MPRGRGTATPDAERQRPVNGARRLAENAGWYGTGAIILAYALVSFRVVSAESVVYQLLNLTGALGIIAISLIKRVRQSITLNVFWAAIAIVALVKLAVG